MRASADIVVDNADTTMTLQTTTVNFDLSNLNSSRKQKKFAKRCLSLFMWDPDRMF